MCSSAKPPTKVPYPPSQLFILTTHCVHQSGDRGPTTSLKKLVRGKRLAGWIVWKGHVGDNFHPTSRYPASHAINASSTSTTIRTTYFPEGYNIDPWPNVTDQDEVMKLWVVNQLMGETEKGDTMILVSVITQYSAKNLTENSALQA